MVTLLKTPFFALFLFVFLLPLCLAADLAAPELVAARDALAATPAMVALAGLVAEVPGAAAAGIGPVAPAMVASVVLFGSLGLVALFLVHRLSVWMVMPVGGGGGVTLPVDMARWLGGLVAGPAALGLLAGLAAALAVFGPARAIVDPALTLAALPAGTATVPAWPMLAAPAIGGFLALGGMMQALRAAGITAAPGRSLRHGALALALAAASPLAVFVLVGLAIQPGTVGTALATHAGWLTLGQVWALAAGAVIAFQVSFSVLATRAHLARRVQRIARDDLRRLSAGEALAMADRSISQRRAQRLAGGGRGMAGATPA